MEQPRRENYSPCCCVRRLRPAAAGDTRAPPSASGAPALRDYLSRPPDADPPPPTSQAAPIPIAAAGYGLPGPPATALSLDLRGIGGTVGRTTSRSPPSPQLMSSSPPADFVSPLRFPYFNALASPSSSVFPSFCKKRSPENEDGSGNRRSKRMMKNRESAARSRARKQAYTYELELAVAHLMEENARLKRQQEKLFAAPSQLPKKNTTLCRTSTAPF